MKLIDPGQSSWGAHRHDTLGRCLRMYGYSYVLEEPRTSTEPQMFGTLIHLALAHRYMASMCEKWEEENEYLAPLDALAVKLEDEPDWDYLAPKVEEFYLQYGWEFDYADKGWTPLAIEKELKMQLRDGGDSFLFTQRADLIVKSASTGKVYIVDHKTASRPGIRPFEVSLQMVGYQIFGEKMFGRKFGGVLINLLRKPGRDGVWKFSRHVLDIGEGMKAAFKPSMLHRRRELAKLEASDLPISNWPMAISDQICWTRYGACPYVAKCKQGTDTTPTQTLTQGFQIP